MKIPLTGFLPEDLTSLFESWGEKKYRAQQIFSWIHRKQANSFSEMTDIPHTLRGILEEKAEISRMNISTQTISSDTSAVKYLFRLGDNKHIESVWMKEGAIRTRNTICVSTQVGCPLGCTFCATAKMGWIRNLDAGEIVEQVLEIQKYRAEKATNIVFMGMGEPFLNYDNSIKAAQILSHPKGQAIAVRRITISTAGILPAIERFNREGHRYRLAISLNATESKLRSSIMPINKKYPIEKILAAAKIYAKTANRPLTFEYVLINGVNDTPADARRFLSLIKGIPCRINLIPFNSIGDKLSRPSPENVDNFYRTLKAGHRVVNLRWSKGTEVNAACGQLFTAEHNRRSRHEGESHGKTGQTRTIRNVSPG